MATLVFASHWQVAPMMPDIEWVAPDKLVHFAVFGLLATLWLRRFSVTLPSNLAPIAAWLAASAFGLADELIQAANPVRFFDPADLLADTSGALLAVLVYRFIPFYRRLLETPVFSGPSKPSLSSPAH